MRPSTLGLEVVLTATAKKLRTSAVVLDNPPCSPDFSTELCSDAILVANASQKNCEAEQFLHNETTDYR